MTPHPAEKRIYVDLEYCYPGMTKESGRPSENDLRQIVQISAILFDHSTGKELESLDVIVKPAFIKNLPPFFIELTNIDQAHVDSFGVDFPQALQIFIEFCKDYPIWTFNADWGVFRQNCTYFNLPFHFESSPFQRVKLLLPSWGLDPNKYSSGTLYQATSTNMTGHVHNALHDVRSMALATHFFTFSKI